MARNQNRYVSILNGAGLNRPYSLAIITEEPSSLSSSSSSSSDSSTPSTPEFDLEFLEPLEPKLDFEDTPARKNRHCIRFDRPPSMPIKMEDLGQLPNKLSLTKGLKGVPTKFIKNIKKSAPRIIQKQENDKLNVIRPHSVDENTKRNIFGFHVRKSCSTLAADDFDNMLFEDRDSTLHLSLTPNWLHSKS